MDAVGFFASFAASVQRPWPAEVAVTTWMPGVVANAVVRIYYCCADCQVVGPGVHATSVAALTMLYCNPA